MKKNIKFKVILFVSIFSVVLAFSAAATITKEAQVNNQSNEKLNIQMLTNGVTLRNSWTEQQKLTASNAASEDLFGEDVAIDGNWIFVGAAGPGDGVPYIGSVYTFIQDGSTWIEQQELTASDGAEDDYFGYRIAIDGDTAIITAFGDDTQTGSAYVFTRSGSTWTQQQKLTASDGGVGYNFGASCDLEGDTAIIGSNWADGTGAAYVFVRSGSTWAQQQKLTPSDAAAEDQIGLHVSLSGDTVLITAEWDDDDGSKSGSAYVFTRSGSTWTQQQKLTASDAVSEDYFGYSCDVDGDTAFIGAHGDDDYGTFSGSTYVFTRSGSTWTQQQKLNPSDGDSWDYFGSDISLDDDTALIAADHDEHSGYEFTGSAYVFTRSGSTWTEQQKLIPSDVNDSYEYFAERISLDGDTAIIGKPYDDAVGQAAGSAYIFNSYNHPPYTPSNPFPEDGTINVPLLVLLNWTGGDPDVGDKVTYDVYFGSSSPPSLDSSNISLTNYNPGLLDSNETYYWKIVSWDNNGACTEGSIWCFTTIENLPPNTPTIDGPNRGKPGTSYYFIFNAVDPNGDDVRFIIDWGDGENQTTQLISSGNDLTVLHTWLTKGTYSISAKAEDIYGAESGLTTLEITIPRNKALYTIQPILLWLFETFPVLKYLLGI